MGNRSNIGNFILLFVQLSCQSLKHNVNIFTFVAPNSRIFSFQSHDRSHSCSVSCSHKVLADHNVFHFEL